jgi:hypothetical protein
MLPSVLHSKRGIQVNIAVMDTFGLLFMQISFLSKVLPNCRHKAFGSGKSILGFVEIYRVDSLVIIYLSQLESLMQVK